LNKELVSLHKAKEDTTTAHQARTQPANATPGQVNIEHAVFVGKASDLLRELKAMKKQQDEPDTVTVIDVPRES
jgi:hypothetical protein